MDKKRLLRSPLVWIAVVLVLYLTYSFFADETRGYVAQPTSVALAQLKDGNVTQATIDDKEQRLRLDLTNPVDGCDADLHVLPGAGRRTRSSTTSRPPTSPAATTPPSPASRRCSRC